MATPVVTASSASSFAVDDIDIDHDDTYTSTTLLWQMTLEEAEQWIRGGVLFPQKKPEGGNAKQIQDHEDKVAKANRYLGNVLKALASAASSSVPVVPKQEESTTTGTQASINHHKRVKVERDVYRILDPSFARGTDVVHLPGSMLSRLTYGGLLNALAGQEGGLVDATSAQLIHTSSSIPVELKMMAKVLQRAVSAKVEMDMLDSTCDRIVEMLCQDLSPVEFAAIRKRVYLTVILGRGTGGSAIANALEQADDLPVAGRTHVEQYYKCKDCNNNDQASFVLDRKNGDIICSNCGAVASESLMHEGSQFRKFEGEADRNHHGDMPNPLYSNAYNMSTTLGGVSFQTGAGMGGYGSGSTKNMETIYRNTHAYTEMNISQMGKDEKKTRVGYKDRQKKDAFIQMTHVGDALSLHEAVVQRAKELFAGFRDDREMVQQFKGVVAACLCEAFDQLSKAGRQILKQHQCSKKDPNANVASTSSSTSDPHKAIENSRASRRNELHSASLAGKSANFSELESSSEVVGASSHGNGGADTVSSSSASDTNGGAAAAQHQTSLEDKPVATWDLDDCRSWLLEASRSIARQWAAAAAAAAVATSPSTDKNGVTKTAASTTMTTSGSAVEIPTGTLDELEGKLVEHTLTLCDVLETEVKNPQGINGNKRVHGRNRVVTPRVTDMGKMGIKWQHAHERGSGGKGGVGNNAMTQQKPSGRTAGQIFMLKTSLKLASMLQDPAAGEAIHRELRALLGRQGAHEKKKMSDLAAHTRLKQMQRKPWLQARIHSQR